MNVPVSYAGRSFAIEFPQNDLNTTVVVNGRPCGFEKNPFVRFSVDVTPGIKPGQVNESSSAFATPGTAINADADPEALRKLFWMPRISSRRVSNVSSIPNGTTRSRASWNADADIDRANLCGRRVRQTNVADKKLDVDVTINTAAEHAQGEVVCQVVDPDAASCQNLRPRPVRHIGGTAKVVNVSGAWPDAKLWWPEPDAQLYTLRTTCA